MSTVEYSNLEIQWCPGCGNFGILRAVHTALSELDIPAYKVLMVSGIGQAGKMPHYLTCNVYNSLHGRPLPVAVGAKLANRELTVITVSGDGDAYGEGGNHLIHTMRRNHDITYLVHNNQIYGLTKGQASPTSDSGVVTRTTPYGTPRPVNPVLMALAGGAGFVARGFAGDIDHLAKVLKQAIVYKGFALVDILQPCVTFNRRNTFEWYRERIYKLEEEEEYSAGDISRALQKAQEWGSRIPIGVFYREQRPVFEDLQPALSGNPLAERSFNPHKITSLFAQFR